MTAQALYSGKSLDNGASACLGVAGDSSEFAAPACGGADALQHTQAAGVPAAAPSSSGLTHARRKQRAGCEIDLYAAACSKVPVKVRLRGHRVTRRSPHAVVLLSLATFGAYALWWQFITTRELRRATDDNSLRPWRELALTVLTCGFASIPILVRNARRLHGASSYFERSHRDAAPAVLGYMLLAPCTGFLLAHAAMHRLQTQLNTFATLADRRERARERELARGADRPSASGIRATVDAPSAACLPEAPSTPHLAASARLS